MAQRNRTIPFKPGKSPALTITHPNAAGEHKLAAAFADAMYQAWGLGAPYAGL